MYLLDTNICIFAINSRPGNVLEILKDKLKYGLFVSSLTIAELEYGVQNSSKTEDNRIALLKFLSIFNIVDFEDKDAIYYGKLKTQLKREGKIIGPIDMLLAAQALRTNMIFVTNNVGEFSRIKELKIEDWSTL